MKKIISLAAVLLSVVFALCACSGEKTDTTTEPAVSAVGENITAEKTGFSFTKDNVCVHLGDNAADIIAALGAPNDSYTSESCAFGGEDTVYYYNGFQISSNNETGTEKIFSIYLEDNTVATEEGITVGHTSDAVISVYGEGEEGSGETSLIYIKDGVKLSFTLEYGAVTSVLYSIAD